MGKNNTLVLLLGPSGVGKTALIREVCAMFPLKYEYPKPYTTRELRTDEFDKIHVDYQSFMDLVNNGIILCPNHLHGNYYGPALSEINRILSSNKTPILDWPIDKMPYLAKSVKSIELFSVYIGPPDLKTLQTRINLDDRDKDGSRFAAAVKELEDVEKGVYANLINQNLKNEGDIRKNAVRLHYLISTSIDEKVEDVEKGDEIMDLQEFKLKNDKYRAARGGEAHLLEVSCAKCSTTLLKYQKDGIGNLLRCYLNRIFYPPELEKLQRESTVAEPKQMPNLECSKCKTVIGIPMRHADGRLAFRLRKGMYSKKRIF